MPQQYNLSPELQKDNDGTYKVIYIGDKKLNMHVHNNIMYIIDPDYLAEAQAISDGESTAPVPYKPVYINPKIDVDRQIDWPENNNFKDTIEYFDQIDQEYSHPLIDNQVDFVQQVQNNSLAIIGLLMLFILWVLKSNNDKDRQLDRLGSQLIEKDKIIEDRRKFQNSPEKEDNIDEFFEDINCNLSDKQILQKQGGQSPSTPPVSPEFRQN